MCMYLQVFISPEKCVLFGVSLIPLLTSVVNDAILGQYTHRIVPYYKKILEYMYWVDGFQVAKQLTFITRTYE